MPVPHLPAPEPTADAAYRVAQAWTNILDLYAKPGVAAACLLLQDEASVDVMVLLFAIDIASRYGLALSGPAVAAADSAVSRWRSQVVQPLRALRRSCTAEAKEEDVMELRRSIQSAELRAERVSLRLLADAFSSLPRHTPESADDLVARVVEFYSRGVFRMEWNTSISTLQGLVSNG